MDSCGAFRHQVNNQRVPLGLQPVLRNQIFLSLSSVEIASEWSRDGVLFPLAFCGLKNINIIRHIVKPSLID